QGTLSGDRMPFDVKLPDIGEGVAEGEVVRWLVKPGDIVREDQPLVEVMTDKASVEIPSPRAGTIAALHVEEGKGVPVGTVPVSIEVAAARRGGRRRGGRGPGARGGAGSRGRRDRSPGPGDAGRAPARARAGGGARERRRERRRRSHHRRRRAPRRGRPGGHTGGQGNRAR